MSRQWLFVEGYNIGEAFTADRDAIVRFRTAALSSRLGFEAKQMSDEVSMTAEYFTQQ